MMPPRVHQLLLLQHFSLSVAAVLRPRLAAAAAVSPLLVAAQAILLLPLAAVVLLLLVVALILPQVLVSRTTQLFPLALLLPHFYHGCSALNQEHSSKRQRPL
jgi:hypothetical protein